MPLLLNIDDVLARLADDKMLCATIFREFVSSYQNFIPEIQALVAEKQWDVAADVAHRLKGVAANIGAQMLSACAADLEQEIKSLQQANTVALLITVMPQTFSAIQRAIQQFEFQLNLSNSDTPLKAQEIHVALVGIKDCYDADYGAALRKVEQLSTQCDKEAYPEIHQLLSLMQVFDIITARTVLHQITA